MKTPASGTITWHDLTVPDAAAVRDFYSAVAGWTVMPVPMGGYDDYCMLPPGAKAPAAGICHARGENSDIPPQWLAYINIPNLAASLRACRKRGGAILRPARNVGGGKMAIIRDPAGAIVALYQHPRPKPAQAAKPAKRSPRRL
jgi:hypothetical protein